MSPVCCSTGNFKHLLCATHFKSTEALTVTETENRVPALCRERTQSLEGKSNAEQAVSSSGCNEIKFKCIGTL